MKADRTAVEEKIAALRELIRCTLDRSKHPALSARLVEERAKLETLNAAPER